MCNEEIEIRDETVLPSLLPPPPQNATFVFKLSIEISFFFFFILRNSLCQVFHFIPGLNSVLKNSLRGGEERERKEKKKKKQTFAN